MKRSTITIFLALLAHLSVADNSAEIAALRAIQTSCAKVKNAPHTIEFLQDLAAHAECISDRELKASAVATYALAMYANGHSKATASTVRYLREAFPESPALSLFDTAQYQTDCSTCRGSGQVQVACKRCSGTGRCPGCSGRGTIERIRGHARCGFCNGSGKCNACGGSGKETTKCTECFGTGRVLSRQLVMKALVKQIDVTQEQAFLKEQEAKGLVRFDGRWITPAEKAQETEGRAALAKARATEAERDLAEQRRKEAEAQARLAEEQRKQLEAHARRTDEERLQATPSSEDARPGAGEVRTPPESSDIQHPKPRTPIQSRRGTSHFAKGTLILVASAGILGLLIIVAFVIASRRDDRRASPLPNETQDTPARASAKTRACPFCGEEILVVAIKCKHCGSEVAGGGPQAIKRSEALGLIALLLPICASFLAWGWLSNMPLIYDPGSKLHGVMAVTILLTAILMAAEANSVGAGTESDRTPSGRKREGPVAWFFFGTLLWIVAFPMWMYRRAKYGLKNLCSGAILICIIFVAVLGLMSAALENQKAEIRRDLENTQRQLEEAQREIERAAEEARRELQSLGW